MGDSTATEVEDDVFSDCRLHGRDSTIQVPELLLHVTKGNSF